jgi:uncharacterized membrane protein YccC
MSDKLVARLDRTSRAAAALAGSKTAPPSFATPPPAARVQLISGLRDVDLRRSRSLRHGIQVACAAVIALVVARQVSPAHMSWVVVTTVGVLQPYAAATLGRAVERVVGTVIGCSLAALLVAAVHSAMTLAVLLIPLSAGAVITRPRSYRLFVLFLTPLFVLMSDHLHASWGTLEARIGDVLVGASIALIAAAVLPTWERERLPEALAKLCDALSRYVDLAITAWQAGRHRSPELRLARRDVGVALEAAEASLERMLSEPARTREAADRAVFLVTYGRRFSSVLTTLDALGQHLDPDLAHELRDYLAAALARARAVVASAPADPPPEPPELPADSRELHRLVEYARLVAQLGQVPQRDIVEP